MTTEAQAQTSNRLGWDHYPLQLTPVERNNVRIRQPHKGEIAEIVNLRTQVFFPNQPDRFVFRDEIEVDRNPETVHAVAFSGDVLVGSGLLLPLSETVDDIHDFKIANVAVRPKYKKNQVGSKILDFLEDIAADLGAPSVGVDATSQAAGFYEKLGYQRQGPPVVYSKNRIEIPMNKVLMPTMEAVNAHL
ncbi:MAG: GNAT family N-acetyltransferase [Patescibacteria group bacterium]